MLLDCDADDEDIEWKDSLLIHFSLVKISIDAMASNHLTISSNIITSPLSRSI